jgi:hypothetical protein
LELDSQPGRRSALARPGGGGGGGGGGGAFVGLGAFAGGNGGRGGNGQDAFGKLDCVQISAADVVATLAHGPDADGDTPDTTVARVVVNLGWNSGGTETDVDMFNFPDEPWERNANLTITMTSAATGREKARLEIHGGPTGPVWATGTVNGQTTFQKWDIDFLEDASGSFGIGLSEFPVTLSVGDEVRIIVETDPDHDGDDDANVFSKLQIQGENGGGLGAPGGVGGEGGGGAFRGVGDGADGYSPGNLLGGAGGGGGAGGEGFENAQDGFSGGDGGTGHKSHAQHNGLFQGVVEIHLDQ